MRLALLASVAALGLGSGTASAQYVVPYSPAPLYGSPYAGGGLSFFSAGPSGSFGFGVVRPGVAVVPSYGYRPYGTYYGGGYYGGGYGHHHHHHHPGYRW